MTCRLRGRHHPHWQLAGALTTDVFRFLPLRNLEGDGVVRPMDSDIQIPIPLVDPVDTGIRLIDVANGRCTTSAEVQ
jgi:hypothetical protein